MPKKPVKPPIAVFAPKPTDKPVDQIVKDLIKLMDQIKK
jgi:hypothetical protein